MSNAEILSLKDDLKLAILELETAQEENADLLNRYTNLHDLYIIRHIHLYYILVRL